MNNPARSKYPEFDILRGLALLMVVLYHSIIVYPVDLHAIPWCAALHRFLWTVQMPVFFFVSGLCYSRRKGYFGSKIRRILIPHLVFSALAVAPRLIPNPLVHEQLEGGLSQAVKDLLLYGGDDWFLLTLLVLCMLFPLLERIMECIPMGEVVGLLAAGVIYIFYNSLPDVFCLNMAGAYLLYYLAGYIFRKRVINVKGSSFSSSLGWMIGGLLVCLLFFCLYYRGCMISEMEVAVSWSREILRIPELICVTGALAALAAFSVRLIGKRTGGFFALCGGWSLQMYLLDPYALVLSRTVLTKLLSLSSPVPIILGNFIADTVTILFISIFIIGRLNILRIICGMPRLELSDSR